MEAGDRGGAATRYARLAERIREVQGHPAVPRAPSGNEPRRLQDDLLVGMDASAAGAPRGWRVPRSFSLVSLARLDRPAPARTILAHFCARRDARCARLVDGSLGPLGAGPRLTGRGGGASERP